MEMECLHVKTTTAIPDVKCTWPPSRGEGGNSPGGGGRGNEREGRGGEARPGPRGAGAGSGVRAPGPGGGGGAAEPAGGERGAAPGGALLALPLLPKIAEIHPEPDVKRSADPALGGWVSAPGPAVSVGAAALGPSRCNGRAGRVKTYIHLFIYLLIFFN